MDINLDEIKENVLGLLKNEAKDLWEGEEDSEFLKDVGTDIANLRFQYLTAGDEDAKKAVRRELDFAEETVSQKLQAKRNLLNRKGQDLLPQILGILMKVAVQLI